jgi:hypothetical protein
VEKRIVVVIVEETVFHISTLFVGSTSLNINVLKSNDIELIIDDI